MIDWEKTPRIPPTKEIMVTYCDNSLVITNASGDKKDLTELHKFREECSGELHRFNLNKLVPVDPADKEQREARWGTAKDVTPELIESDVIVAGDYFIRFLSVETSIVNWVKTVAPRYPELYFHLDYFNARKGFEGELEICNQTVFNEYLNSI
jgi:hypothetical protein